MQKRRAAEPREQGSVLHRVPSPVAAPAEHVIGPRRAQHHAGALEQPRDQRPAACGENPGVARLPRDQRADGEGERHREADVAEVQHRRVDRHRRVLQQRAQAVAVRHRRDQLVYRQHLERVGDEVVEHQEEGLNRGQHPDHPGHHVAMLAAVGEDYDRRVRGQQEAPQQQRAFLSAPPRRILVQHGHGAVGMLGNVGEAEIAGDQRVDQDAGRRGDQRPDSVDRPFPANYKKRLVFKAANDARRRGVQGQAEGQQDGQRTQIFHITL